MAVISLDKMAEDVRDMVKFRDIGEMRFGIDLDVIKTILTVFVAELSERSDEEVLNLLERWRG
jgi:hypothetical protein